MADFADVVRSRRMTRAFTRDPIERAVLDDLVDLASRSPSAGKTQGWHAVVLDGDHPQRFWEITLPGEKRSTFRWNRLVEAPVVVLPLADPDAYVRRYSEPDKARTGLGEGAGAWPVPYWTVDASMAVMTLLLAAEDVGLGALFFGVFHGEAEVRAEFGIPDRLQLLGALAVGHPHPDDDDPGRSATRRRRPPSEIIHRNGW